MISQEELLRHLLNEDWKEILDIIYNERTNIKNDALLTFACVTFVNEFLKKVETYSLDDKEVLNHLATLNILHQGKFYILSNENHKKLTLEIIKRKPLEEAYSYAKYYPDDNICKKVISDYDLYLAKKKGIIAKSKLNLDSIEMYNRLFELINQQNTAVYFPGPRFINTVREFLPYFPTYQQYIGKRNEEGKSTSRKIFYYDILQELDDDIKEKTIRRILEITRPFEQEKVYQIENIIDGKHSEHKLDKIKASGNETQSTRPIVFISYSWDDEEHKEWVLNLAKKLSNDGVEVILDRYFLKPGANLPFFVENNIERAHKIIMVFTPNYKLKADKRTGGVGYEYSIMNIELYKNISSNERFIPLLRRGEMSESIPTFMQQFIHIDVKNDDNFENSYNDLIREIYNEPEIKKPKVGSKPIFE